MKTNRSPIVHSHPGGRQYALRRGLGFWELTFEGRRAIFKHELGALYVGCLLLDPPREPIHAVALALKAREMSGQAAGPCELVQQRSLGLEDAATVRALWRRQRALERVLEEDNQIEPVKAEALRELEEVTEFLRKSPWRSRGGAERCVEAVGKAIRRLYRHLCGAMDGAGMPHPVLRAFGRHLHDYLLIPSGRGGGRGGARLASAPGGCFTYEPPPGVAWAAGATRARLSQAQHLPHEERTAFAANSGPVGLGRA
jgi:hypothetical protein